MDRRHLSPSAETIAKRVAKMIGRPSPLKGRKISEEHKSKITGRKHTLEELRRMSEGQKKAYQNGRNSTKGRVPWNKGKKLPQMSGENHPRYVKDRSNLASTKNGNEYRNSPLSLDWAKEVKNRDNWRCKVDNDECSSKLEAHHILSWREHPELRYVINNGITLCVKHHPRKREDELRLSPYFQKLVIG